MYYRYYFSHFDTEPHFGVRTKRYKLIHFNRIKQWELFDLAKDPMELRNEYGNTGYRYIVEELKKELTRLQTELKDNIDDVGDHPRTGME